MSVLSIGKTLERIELIRSNLRWSSRLERQGIQKILHQINQLRNELLFLSRQERIKKGLASKKPVATQQTPSERKQALQENDFSFTGVFGENPKLLTVLETLNKAAKSDFPVLIEGESGTGKELMAKVVHSNSDRSLKPFVSVNCGAIPDPLIESELFGHARGAFTGADNARAGKFELANHGVLFLDELGELSVENQVKLLRALQTGEIQRVGSDKHIRVDVRIVAATNKKLYEMTLDGTFREDLYYRLGVVTVTIPPLRERLDEIPLLIDYFLNEASEKMGKEPVQLSPQLEAFLKTHTYRGNIRELQNIIYRVSCLADGVAGLNHLPEIINPAATVPSSDQDGRPLSLEQVRSFAKHAAEELFLKTHLKKHHGHVSKMAQELGMNRSYLQNLMKRHGFRAKDFRD
ncbi:MAG: transcriptional regulator [Proteobacteria bacterium]|nr:MAG: transcriptional regulator [Pseudomonadota bacterium]